MASAFLNEKEKNGLSFLNDVLWSGVVGQITSFPHMFLWVRVFITEQRNKQVQL